MATSPEHDTPAHPPGRSLPPEGAVRDHLANERTLLAWQRTALGVVALGFLVDRFALDGTGSGGSVAALAPALGLALVALGGIVSLFGAYRFMRTEHQIDTGTFETATLVQLALTGAIVVGAIGIMLLLATSPH